MADLNWAPYAISADGANSAIHGPLPRAGGELSFPFTWQQLQQIVANLVNEFLRQVAVALGAIEIFGFKPYEALVEIGEKIQAGVDNFNILLTAFGLPTVNDVATLLSNQANDFATFLAATGQATFAALGAALQALIDFLTAIPANLLSGAMPTTVTLSGTQLGTLLQYINSSGQFAAAQLTGALNTGLTFSGTALSVLLQYLNSSGQFSAAQLTGGINTAVTFGGTALSTLLQYLNSSGQFAAGQLTGAINGSLTLGGVTLSTLVTNINSSGQLLAAGMTGALGTGLTVGGVTLGTLFTNINSSGQLLLSGATGALNTAVTIGGQTVSTLVTNWNAAVADVNSLITGIGGSVIGDVTNYLQNVPNTAVQGLVGFGTNIGNSITALSDGVWQGLRAFLGIPSGVGPPQVSSAAQQVRVDLNNATDIASASAAFQAKQSISKQSYLSIDPSADPVFPLAQINGASPSTVSVTQAKSIMGIIGLPDNGLKKSLVWLGGSLTNISAVYVNLYKVNTTTGVFTRTHASLNIIGSLTSPVSGVAWQFYNLPMTAFFPTLQGEWYVAEIVVVGTGTYTVVGLSNSWMPTHPSVYPKALGASRSTLDTVTYDATGGGQSKSNQSTPTTTLSWSHTATAGSYVVVAIATYQASQAALSSKSVTYDGVAMTLLGTIRPNNTDFGLVALWGLPNAPGGAKTVAASATASSGNTTAMSGNSVSYTGVGSVETVASAAGSGSTALSTTATGVTGGRVVNAFSTVSSGTGNTLSAYNQSQRFLHNSAAGTDVSLLIGDSGTVGSVTFSANQSASTFTAGITAVLQPGVVPSPASISSPTYDAATPWLALAGAAGRSSHPPETVEFETAGTFTYTVPSWIEDGDYIDVVPCGAGAGGSYQGGIVASPPVNTYDSTSYKGGGAGSWNPVRLRYGDAYDIPTGTTTFTVNVGAGGAGGAYPGTSYAPVHASDGANTTVVITGYPTITANGGAKDGTTQVVTASGDTPGNTAFQGVTYFGGAVATTGTISASGWPVTAGNSPGGGGVAGATRRQGGFAYDVSGGAGAPGACYITAVQNS